MNPSKRKKIYRANLKKQQSVVVEEVKVEEVKVEEVKVQEVKVEEVVDESQDNTVEEVVKVGRKKKTT